jgi:hypothetical protein
MLQFAAYMTAEGCMLALMRKKIEDCASRAQDRLYGLYNVQIYYGAKLELGGW